MSLVKSISQVIWTPTYKTQRLEKFEQAIDVHGYRGSSKKKHNGVVNIKPDDTQILKAIDKFKNTDKDFINAYLTKNPRTFLIDVKIVAHVQNGNRAVGSLYANENNEYTLFLIGFTNYNYQLF